MPSFYRILEVTICSLLKFLPFLLLALHPFAKHFRFPKPVIVLGTALLIGTQIVLDMFSAFSGINEGFLSLLSTAVYALFYFIAVKVHFGKTLFTLLMLSNITNFVMMSSKALEGFLFGNMAYEAYRYTYAICVFFAHLFVTLPLFFYFRRSFSKGIHMKTDKIIWRYLWLIPATFYLIWNHHIYGNTETAVELALQPMHILYLFLINLGAIFINHMIIRMVTEQDHNITLKEQNHQLALQNLQYENLKERIDEARRAKHDLRHHITVMDNYLCNGEYEKLREYLNKYRKALPDDSKITFCDHLATNALLLYFAQQAKNQKIDYDVAVVLPENINFPENTLTVVLGNLIENAMEACLSVKDRLPFIRIRGKISDGAIFFMIENTYADQILKDQNGYFLSTKNKERGLGLSSVRNIVKECNGILDIETDGSLFRISLIMNVN